MMRPILLAVAWIGGATVAVGLALRHVSGDELRVARYAGYVLPWLLLFLAPGGLWAWRARAPALAAVLGGAAAFVVLAHAPQLRGTRAIAAPPAPTLSVMSYNTWSRNRDAARIARVVLDVAPDLLLLQEIPPDVFHQVAAGLAGLYGGAPVHFAYEAGVQQAVVSRHPLGPSAAMPEKGNAQKVVVETPAGPVTVLNVHPLRTRGWRHRYDQLAALLEEDVLPARTPVVLGGDLNAPEHSQPYRLLAAHLGNAHRAAGSGFGFTYPAAGLRVLGVPAFPVVRIDHVFFTRELVALRGATLPDSGGSDHRPVVAVLALTGGARPAAASAMGERGSPAR
jgi:endonuclease/exonuclease/phosphatase family metal-dependent hydrolase